ncbi:MAG: hypothetical protein M1608_11600, partial [Candidatus Omnitrophica bacterium]|nr:hypothetical protein [Candidatus Omnitrophota bacterium]
MKYKNIISIILFAVFAVGFSLGTTTAIAVSNALPSLEAQWIWTQCEHRDPFQFVRFRREFVLDQKPGEATAFVAADTFYRLWINGNLVMHGPARSSAGKATVDPVELGGYLRTGTNRVEAEVFHGVARFEALAQAPGFLCDLRISMNGKEQNIPTDGRSDGAVYW